MEIAKAKVALKLNDFVNEKTIPLGELIYMTLEELDAFLRKVKDFEMPRFSNWDNVPDSLQNTSDKHVFNEEIIMQQKPVSFLQHPRFSETIEHSHSFIELIYVYSGHCHQKVNNVEITMDQGEICILDTNVVHSIETAGENDIIINCLMSKRYFDTSFLSRLSGNDLFSTFLVHAIYQSKDYNDYILLRSGKSEIIHEVMRRVLCEFYTQDMCYSEVINSYIIIIFSELLRIYKNDINSLNYTALKNTEISDIILYIQNNYRSATLDSAAQHFKFHPNYLSKIIKQLSGRNFLTILHEARLKRACILLETTNVTIDKIVNDIGYSNVNFFYKKFKEYYGVTPAEYRKNL